MSEKGGTPPKDAGRGGNGIPHGWAALGWAPGPGRWPRWLLDRFPSGRGGRRAAAGAPAAPPAEGRQPGAGDVTAARAAAVQGRGPQVGGEVPGRAEGM